MGIEDVETAHDLALEIGGLRNELGCAREYMKECAELRLKLALEESAHTLVLDERDKLRAELQQAQNEADALRDELGDEHNRLTQVRVDLQQARERVAELGRSLAAAKADRESFRADVEYWRLMAGGKGRDECDSVGHIGCICDRAPAPTPTEPAPLKPLLQLACERGEFHQPDCGCIPCTMQSPPAQGGGGECATCGYAPCGCDQQ